MSTDGYERMLELVAENPAQQAEELVKMATEEGYDSDDAEKWLDTALEAEDVIEFDGKHWVVRKGRFAWSEYDHPV